MKSTTSKQFLEWSIFLQEEECRTRHQDHYLAQIAAEIRRGNVDPNKVSKIKDKDFLLVFETEEPDQSSVEKNSKKYWLSALGVKNNGI